MTTTETTSGARTWGASTSDQTAARPQEPQARRFALPGYAIQVGPSAHLAAERPFLFAPAAEIAREIAAGRAGKAWRIHVVFKVAVVAAAAAHMPIRHCVSPMSAPKRADARSTARRRRRGTATRARR